MLKKLLAAVASVALAVGLVAIVSAPASAHDHSSAAECVAGVKVDLDNYAAAKTVNGVQKSNHITITQDGKVTLNTDFGTQLIHNYPWAASADSHSWRVVVTAYDDASYSFDTGTQKVVGCDTSVTPAVVTTNNAYCIGSTVGGGGYAIPTTSGVSYQKLTGGAWVTIAAGPHGLAVGEKVSIRAVAETGYKLSGKTEWDDLSITGPTSCAPAACIANSAVSYTYDPATNSGKITVAEVAKSTGALCHPFFVTATSWKYTKAAQWPQTRDIVQKLPQITKPGVYPYAAQVTCGQGDIYASFTAQPDPTPTLTAPQTPFTENFLASMGFTGPSPTSMHQPTTCFAPPVCIPNSAVSYGYDPATNSGAITVANVGNSTGVLCNPFYVTATSWKYVTSATWPQTRDVVQKLPQITKPGVYPYAAQVTCGQGDIYASFTAQPDPTPTLNSPNNPFSEHFLHQMGFVGPSPTYVQQPSSCFDPATPGSVVFTNQVCDTAHPGQAFSGYFVITAGHHVTYKASISSVDNGAVKTVAAGTTTVSPSDVVTITVVADPGYALATPIDPAQWTFHYLASQGCLGDGKAVKPAFESQVCVTAETGGKQLQDAFITIPTTVGVQYFINDTAHNAGDVVLQPGVYQVTAKATTGYQLYTAVDHPNDPAAYPTGGWTITLASVETCSDLPTHSVQPINVTSTPAVCTLDGSERGSITVGQVDTVDFTPYVQYSIDGVAVNSITTAVAPGIHTVTAVAKSPNDTLQAGPHVLPDGTAKWTVEIAAPSTPCGDLPTDSVQPINVTSTSAVCTPSGSQKGTITVGQVEGVDFTPFVQYSIDGVAVSSITTSVAPGVHTVTAVAKSANDSLQADPHVLPDGTASWTVTVASVGALCGDLKTLALTGSSPLGWIVLGYLMLVSGLALLALRFVRRRGEQG